MHNVETTSKKPSRHFYGIAKLAVKSLDRELFLVAFSFTLRARAVAWRLPVKTLLCKV